MLYLLYSVTLNLHQIADIYLPIYIGSTVYFAYTDALKVISIHNETISIEYYELVHMQGSFVDSLKEVNPTFFFGVPR